MRSVALKLMRCIAGSARLWYGLEKLVNKHGKNCTVAERSGHPEFVVPELGKINLNQINAIADLLVMFRNTNVSCRPSCS